MKSLEQRAAAYLAKLLLAIAGNDGHAAPFVACGQIHFCPLQSHSTIQERRSNRILEPRFHLATIQTDKTTVRGQIEPLKGNWTENTESELNVPDGEPRHAKTTRNNKKFQPSIN